MRAVEIWDLFFFKNYSLFFVTDFTYVIEIIVDIRIFYRNVNKIALLEDFVIGESQIQVIRRYFEQ